jgi:DNA-binding MarR family transcriptional regulator
MDTAGDGSRAGPVGDTGPSDHEAQVERLEQQVSLLMRRGRSTARRFAERIHPDVDAGDYAVLLAIAQSGPLRLVDLAEEFGLDKSTMSRQVSALVRLGLVDRTPDPADGRAFLLAVSAEGASRLAEITRSRRLAWRARLSAWSTADISSLAAGLERLAGEVAAIDRADETRRPG